MAWSFIAELPISREQYDRLSTEIGQNPEGLILHTASEKGGAMRVIDVWESKEAFERFEQETLMPAAGRAGIEMPGGPPPREEFDVHNMRGRAS